jgi:CubicO group peptidase (beta-lactamase class C family)
MKVCRLVLVLLTLALLAPGGPRPAAARAPVAPDLARVDRYVAEQRARLRIPGASLGIVQGDRIVHLQGFGEARLARARFGQVEGAGSAMTAQTPLLIGSLTKSFTAVAIMQLVEQGKVELDAPVQRYLPWFRVADPEASTRITVRHLLSHTSGLSGRREAAILREEDIGADAIERQVRALAAVELAQPVGAAWQYASANYAVAGLIVETVGGQPYEAYVQQHILTPLQMRWSFTSPAAARGAGLADGHRYWFGRPAPAQLPYPRGLLPAGYLVSSAEDMSRYLLAHLNGGRVGEARILSPEGVAELHRPGFALEAGVWSGLGWGVADLDGVRVLQHSGNTNHFSSEMWLLPEAGLGFVLLTNAHNQLHGGAVRAIGEGITMILTGQEPQPVQLSPAANVVYGVLLGLAGLELLGVARGVRTLRRWRASPPEPALVRQVVLPLAGHLLVALLFLGVIPALLLGGSLANALFLVPDLGWTLALAGTAAAGWGLLRTAFALRLLRRPAITVAGASPGHA